MIGVPFLFRGEHAPAGNELDKLRVYIGYQQVHQPSQTWVAPRWSSSMCASSCRAICVWW